MARMSFLTACLIVIGAEGLPLYSHYSQHGSDTVPELTFEVASVKANTTGSDRASYSRSPGALNIHNAPLRDIIAQAYDIQLHLQRFTVHGGPDKLLASRFDITAKIPPGTAAKDVNLMLRALLADRFKLKAHTERRETPVYAIIVARAGRLGPELRKSKHDCTALLIAINTADKSLTNEEPPRDAAGRPMCWASTAKHADAGPLGTRLIWNLQAFVDRPLVDATGLSDNYEWRLDFDPVANGGNTDLPSIYAAFEEQLGLKLERRRVHIPVLVIDSVEVPAPN